MRAWLRVIGLLLVASGLLPSKGFAAVGTGAVNDIRFTSIDGKPMPLSDFAGKTVLVVNTASQCGFTPQYAGLEKLYETYKDKGLVIIGVPSNDFGNQEPGDEKTIKEFTSTQYHITFPLTQKEVVTGEKAHPFFRKVRADLGVFATPKWNFYKYLVSPEGKLVAWWSPKGTPDNRELIKTIEANLPKTETTK